MRAEFDVRVDMVVMLRKTTDNLMRSNYAVVVKNGSDFFEIPYEGDGDSRAIHKLLADGLTNMRELNLL